MINHTTLSKIKLGSIFLIICLATFTSHAQTSHTGMRNITAMEIAADMAPGLNLWNTLDAHCNWKGDDQGLVTETCWGNPYTTPEIIAGMAQRGFKTLRLPVTYYMHTGCLLYTSDAADD